MNKVRCIGDCGYNNKKRYNILIIPENKIMGYSIATNIRKALKNSTVCICTANYEDAKELINDHEYDIIVLASSIPGKESPFKLIEEYVKNRENFEKKPIIIFIGGNSKIYEEYTKLKETLNLDNAHYFIKPVNIRKFKNKIKELTKN